MGTAATGPFTGSSTFPTGPPHHAPASPTVEPVNGRQAGWGWRALLAFIAGGLVASAGFASARIGRSETATAPSETTATTIASPTEEALARAADEPAAFVAETLGPSVVQIETDIGLGSGVIYRDGLIITNNHVIEGARDLSVILSTGRRLPAELTGADATTDIAVVSVGSSQQLPVADLALDSTPRVGQVAVAIGSPFQLQQSVTAGIVSAVNRPIANRNNRIVAMIQTDAPINPGNSGGALADKQGRVIGINTAIQTDGFSSTNAGVGFAVPIDTAVRIADLLVGGQPIRAGFLGVRGSEPASGDIGVEITEVTTGSAAESAGLLVGDRVLTIDGAPVTSLEELAGLVLARQAGDQVELEVDRDGRRVRVNATLQEKQD